MPAAERSSEDEDRVRLPLNPLDAVRALLAVDPDSEPVESTDRPEAPDLDRRRANNRDDQTPPE